MGESTTLELKNTKTAESANKGNWTKENVFNKSLFDEDNLSIYKNVIHNYSRVVKPYKNSTKKADDNKLQSPNLYFPKLKFSYDIFYSKKYYKKVQNWQGIVTNIDDESFTANLYDLTSGGTNEIVEFDLGEVSPSDKKLLDVGAQFYWSVGRYMENGQLVNRSEIRFQRLITLDSNDIEKIKINIDKKYSNLKERKIVNPGA